MRARPSPSASAGRRSFTLVEILVVLAIIAVLMGLLFPALGKARTWRSQTVCASNLRQIQMSAVAWANDNDGWIPYAQWTYYWRATNASVYLSRANLSSNTVRCPAAAFPGPGYGINNRLVTGNPMWGAGNVYYSSHGRYRLASLSGTKTIFFADTAWSGNSYMAMNAWFECRHNGKANLVYVDGHVDQADSNTLSALAPWIAGIADQQ